MSLIQVTKDFVFTLEDGTMRVFKQGEHEVEDHIAAHWYVQAHSQPVASPVAASAPASETPPFATETEPSPVRAAPPPRANKK